MTKATEVLYGGAAGGGKSHLMRVASIMWCATIPGLQVYLFRRKYPDLVRNHMDGPKGFRSMLADWVLSGQCKIVEGEIRFWNGSKIHLCHCKDAKDVMNYHGAEIHVLMIDEATQFTEDMYTFLRTRVRMVGINLPAQYKGMFPRILLSANPIGVGVEWVKRTFVDPHSPETVWQTEADEGGKIRQYIPARLEDNPTMLEDDPTYEMTLQGLGSPALVRALRLGDWSAVEGAYFGDISRLVIPPFTIPPGWAKFRAFDWGSAKPFAVGWYAISSGDVAPFRKGEMIHYREWYGCSAPNKGLKLHVPEVAAGILSRDYGDKIDLSIADPAIFAEDGGPAISEEFSRHGVRWQRGDNKRVPGWQQMRDRFNGYDGRPMFWVFDTCRHFLRTVPFLVHDESKPEDLDTDGEDHVADSARYMCMARPWSKPPPIAPRPPGLTLADMIKLQADSRESKY